MEVIGSPEFVSGIINHGFWGEFIPAFAKKDSDAEGADLWTINQHETNYYDLKNRQIFIQSKEFAVPAIVIIESELERKRQAEGFYTMHGSAISNRDVAIGLIGGISGMGKTTLASFAADNGWEWLADEKFTLHDDMLVGGVDAILNDTKTHSASGGNRPSYDQKPRPLKLLCMPLITDETVATVYELDLARSEWQVYDEITRDISQINGSLDGFDTPLFSRDDKTLSTTRNTYAKQLAKVTPVVYVRGNKPSVLEAINQLTRQQTATLI
jgi:hypothetical protein